MKPNQENSVAEMMLKTLVFEMHAQNIPQEAIAKYVGKAKKTVNEMLKPIASTKAPR